jgi:hypothetical protein
MKRYILFVIPIVLTLIVSVPIGGLAFARSVDQGDNGGSDQQGSGKRDTSYDPISGNPAQKKCGGMVCNPSTCVLHSLAVRLLLV